MEKGEQSRLKLSKWKMECRDNSVFLNQIDLPMLKLETAEIFLQDQLQQQLMCYTLG